MTPTLLPLDDFKAWKDRITAAQRLIESVRPKWQENTAAFEGKPLAVNPKVDTVIVNKDFPRVKHKQAQLFFQCPDLQGKPKREAYAQAAPVYQAVVNHYLTKRMGVVKMVDEILTDVLCPAGIGVSKIGYQAFEDGVREIPVGTPEEVAELQAGALEVPMQSVPNVIHEEYFWKRVSPAKFLYPGDFAGSDFDDAAWIGFEFRAPLPQVRAQYNLPDDFEGGPRKDDALVATRVEDPADLDSGKTVRGWEIWYKASLFDATVKHPLKQRRLVIIDGLDRAAVHADSPYQRFDETTGRFLVGLTRFPVRVLSLTYVSDKALPPSDCSITRPQANELNRSRSQMIRQREMSLPMRWADTAAGVIDQETIDAIEKGDFQGILRTNGPGDRVFGEIARAQYPRESFEIDRIVRDDFDESWSMGKPQLGTETSGETTAEEIRAMQSGANTRLDYERAKVLRWYVEGAEMVGTLLQLFATDKDFIEVVGEDGLKSVQQWDRTTIAGEFVLEAKPDSALRIDAATERQQSLNLYQMTANEPWVNRQKLVEMVLRKHNLDPTPIMVQQPPEKKPDSPAISYRFGGEELSPLNPAFPIVMEILNQAGIIISPEAVQMAQGMALNQALLAQATAQAAGPAKQPPHGGAVHQAEPLSKHHADGKMATELA